MSTAKKEVMCNAAQAFSDAEKAQGRANIGAASSDGLASTNYAVAQVTSTLQGKQDLLTAGDNITITDNVIAAVIPSHIVGTEYFNQNNTDSTFAFADPNTSTYKDLFSISLAAGQTIDATIDFIVQASQSSSVGDQMVSGILQARSDTTEIYNFVWFSARTSATQLVNEGAVSRRIIFTASIATTFSLRLYGIAGYSGTITLREGSIAYNIFS